MIKVTYERGEISSHVTESASRGSAVQAMGKIQWGNISQHLTFHFIIVSPLSFLALRPSELFSHTAISRSGVRPEMCRAWAGRGVGGENNTKSCGKGKEKVCRGPGVGGSGE